jgi:flagellar hook-associated protein FlgK
MSLGFGFNAGLNALNAAQVGLQTANNNIANVNTPGYSRQRLNLVSASPFGVGGLQIGTGVNIRGISQRVDDGHEVAHALVGEPEASALRSMKPVTKIMLCETKSW